jgi:hypothetical protein
LPEAPLHLHFDESVGKPAVDRIRLVFDPLSDRFQIDSHYDQAWCGLADTEWLKRLSDERAIVLHADRGRRKRGEKLPLLLYASGIT